MYANSCWPVAVVPAATHQIGAFADWLQHGSTCRCKQRHQELSLFAPVTSMERPPCSGGQCWRGVTRTPRFSVRLCSLPRRWPSVLSGNPCQVSSSQHMPQCRSRDGAGHTATAAELTLASLMSLLGNDAGPKDAPQLLITLEQLRSDCQQWWLVVHSFLCSSAAHLYATEVLHEAIRIPLTSAGVPATMP